jgi:hypothetical protein
MRDTGVLLIGRLMSTAADDVERPLFRSFSPRGELRETRIEGRLVAEVVKRLFRSARRGDLAERAM